MKKKQSTSSWLWNVIAFTLFAVFMWGSSIGQTALEVTGFQRTPWLEMTEALDEELAKHDGAIGIYIKDLQTGKVYDRDAGKRFASASLIKLPIMAATFQAIWDGHLKLDNSLLLKHRHRRGGSGRLKWTRGSRNFPLSHLIYQMITRSDNTATAVIIDKLGYTYLNRSFRLFGLNTTRIDPVGMSLADRIHPARENYTTPREMGQLLEKIYRRELVSDGLSDLMLEILKDAGGRQRLGQFLPENWSLARKTGLLRKNCHDVGIVFTERGDFIICVLTREAGNYRKAKKVIASLGKTAYEFLGHS